MSATLPFPARRRVLAAGLGVLAWPAAAWASGASANDLNLAGDEALRRLYDQSGKARELGQRARAILIFPSIKKAGFMVGGQGGNGVLLQRGRPIGYFSLYSGSFGLQAGIQKYSYALFFITQSALDYLQKSKGWSIGSGPSVVVVDQGFAKTMNTTTLSQDVYAMPFGQKGLMGGLARRSPASILDREDLRHRGKRNVVVNRKPA